MIHLSPPLWYGLAFGLTATVWIAGKLLYALLCFLWSLGVENYLRRVAYPPILAESKIALTWQELLWAVLYLTANGLCLGVRCTGRTELGSRAGILATINLVPLLVGTRLSTVADLLGLQLRKIASAHRWIGLVVVSEAIIHTILTLDWKKVTWDASKTCGIIVRSHHAREGRPLMTDRLPRA